MFYYAFKVLLVICVLQYHERSGNPLKAAVIWGVAVFALGAIFDDFELALVFWVLVSCVIVFFSLWLLDYLDNRETGLYWITYFLVIGVLTVVA